MKANRFAASQQIPFILRNTKVRYRIHKCPPPVPIRNQLDPVHNPHPNSWRSNLLLYSHLNLGLPMDSSSQVSSPKPGTRFSPPPYVPHGPPISIFLNLWLAQYWANSDLYRKNLELFWDIKILKHEIQGWQIKHALHLFVSHEGLTLSRFSCFAKFIFIEGLFEVPLVLFRDTLHWGNFSQYFKWTF